MSSLIPTLQHPKSKRDVRLRARSTYRWTAGTNAGLLCGHCPPPLPSRRFAEPWNSAVRIVAVRLRNFLAVSISPASRLITSAQWPPRPPRWPLSFEHSTLSSRHSALKPAGSDSSRARCCPPTPWLPQRVRADSLAQEVRAHNCSVKIDNDPTVREVGAPGRQPPIAATRRLALRTRALAGCWDPRPAARHRVRLSLCIARSCAAQQRGRPADGYGEVARHALARRHHAPRHRLAHAPLGPRPRRRGAHRIRNDVSTPLVALEAAGALRVRVRGCAGEGAGEGTIVGVRTACGRTLHRVPSVWGTSAACVRYE